MGLDLVTPTALRRLSSFNVIIEIPMSADPIQI